MPRTATRQPYFLLARHYDQLMGDYSAHFARARQRLLGRHLRNVRTVCDLACGTGATALELARRGAGPATAPFTWRPNLLCLGGLFE